VLAYICRDATRAQRANLVSGFLLQVQALRVGGKALYPAWAALVRRGFAAADQLTRYRLVMGSCVAPCLVGLFLLLAACLGGAGETRAAPPFCTGISRPWGYVLLSRSGDPRWSPHVILTRVI
jgi:hypothetical protein